MHRHSSLSSGRFAYADANRLKLVNQTNKEIIMPTPLQTKDEFYADTHNNTDNTLAIPAYHAAVNASELVTEATPGTDTHTRRCLHYTDTLYNKQIGRWQDPYDGRPMRRDSVSRAARAQRQANLAVTFTWWYALHASAFQLSRN